MGNMDTFTEITRTVVGNKHLVVYTAAFSSSYATGGDALTGANLGLDNIDFLIAEPKSGYTFDYDHDNATLLAYRNPAVAADIALTDEGLTAAIGIAAAGANLQSGVAGPTATTNAPVTQAAGALAQVTAAVNLSSIVVRIMALG